MPRQVTLVLQSTNGAVLGALAPFAVELPWWAEVASVVEAARVEHGADVTVLRLLRAEPDPDDPSGMAGSVTYAAEFRGLPPAGLRAVDARTEADARDDHALRLPWARPAGPARELAWAGRVLAQCGCSPTGRPQQIRTWNLSSIWSIPTTQGTVWLKSVPPFFNHEGPVIEWLADPALPPLLAHAEGRVLMADIAGVDHYDAPLALLERAVETLVVIQHRVSARVDELLALGLPDWRWPALRPLIEDVVDRHVHELEREEQQAIERLCGELDARCEAIDGCGLPTTLTHGDFHPGNLRGPADDASSFVILDWGDSGVGHPLFDVAAMTRMLPAARRDALLATWVRAWRERCPGSDPGRAAELLAPIAALRQAVTYRLFLDAIEPSERCYHASDPARWLRVSARITGGG